MVFPSCVFFFQPSILSPPLGSLARDHIYIYIYIYILELHNDYIYILFIIISLQASLKFSQGIEALWARMDQKEAEIQLMVPPSEDEEELHLQMQQHRVSPIQKEKEQLQFRGSEVHIC